LSFVRIVLVGMPVLLRNITRDVIEAQPWAEVAGEYDAPVPLVEAVRLSGANVVVVGDAPDVEGQATALLRHARQVGVQAISDDGRETVLYELTPKKRHLGEVSPERLVDAIRTAVSPSVEV
jgi:hypothetical protein